MNGVIKKTLLLACVACGLTLTAGCHKDDLVDPCWPERYEFAARNEVVDAMAPQVRNGHVLDQTVWNSHFLFDEEKGIGTDVLTAGGREHLAYLARRRPCPDPCVFVQTAQDLPYDPAHPEKFVEEREKLDSKRVLAVQKFLDAYTAGRGAEFHVERHDPSQVGMAGIAAVTTSRGYYIGFTGLITAGANSTASPPSISSASVNSTSAVTQTNISTAGPR